MSSSHQSLVQLVELTSNVISAFTTALFVADPEKKILSLKAFHSLSLHLDEKASIAYGDGPIGWVAENGEPYLEEFFHSGSSSLKLYKKKEALKDFLAVPVAAGELLGVLVVDSKESYRFTARSQKIVAGFAEQMAEHLCREKQLAAGSDDDGFPYGDLLQYSQSVAASLHPAGMAEKMIRIPPSIVQCDARAVVWVEEDKRTGKVTLHEGWGRDLTNWSVTPGRGLVGSCLKNPVSLLSGGQGKRHGVLFRENEGLGHFAAALAVPVVFQGRLLAALVCAVREAPGLTGSHLRRMNILGSSVAPALFYAREKRQWDYDKNLDQVTQIPNYRCLVEYQEKIEREVFVGNRPVFLLSVHLSNLHKLYEIHGVTLGDHLLRQVVAMLTKVIPSPKFLFKYSDTTLLILIMKTQHAEIENLETKLRQVFEKTPFYVDRQSLQVEVELGLATYPAEGVHLGELANLSWARAIRPLEATHDH